MTANTDKKLRDKIMKEKKPDKKKAKKMTKQKTYEKKNKKNTTPKALISNRKNEIKEEPIQRMDKFNTRPRYNINNNRLCRFCNAPNWSQTRKFPALGQTCYNCGKKDHFARACRQKESYKRKVRNVTETENSTIGEESNESESSIYRIERINRIVDKNNYLPTITGENQRNGGRIYNRHRITNIDNAGGQHNKERHRNSKRVAKKIKLTIRNIRLDENSQSEKRQNVEKFQDLFRNNTTVKDAEINIQLKPGHYPVKQKARPNK